MILIKIETFNYLHNNLRHKKLFKILKSHFKVREVVKGKANFSFNENVLYESTRENLFIK